MFTLTNNPYVVGIWYVRFSGGYWWVLIWRPSDSEYFFGAKRTKEKGQEPKNEEVLLYGQPGQTVDDQEKELIARTTRAAKTLAQASRGMLETILIQGPAAELEEKLRDHPFLSAMVIEQSSH